MEENEIYKIASELVESYSKCNDEKQKQIRTTHLAESIKVIQRVDKIEINYNIDEIYNIIQRGKIYYVASIGKYYFIAKYNGPAFYPGIDMYSVVETFKELEKEVLEQELEQQEKEEKENNKL